jgi:putative hemolysin
MQGMRAEPLIRGGLVARLAQTPAEVEAAQRLRHLAFVATRGRGPAEGRDADSFDDGAAHLLVCDQGRPVACCRLMLHRGAGVLSGYTAGFYDLTPFAAYPAPMLELGRFCLHPDRHDPDLLRLAWAMVARLVDAEGVGLLFGCSSFDGADPARHAGALAALVPHAGPEALRPRALAAPGRVALAELAQARPAPDALPALLRSYLALGGWVSDHAVRDPALDTLHVLTAVDVAAIPPARARALRLLAGLGVG